MTDANTMLDAPADFPQTIDEGRLRKLLTSRKPADKAELTAWLIHPSPHDTAPLLAAVGGNARSPVQRRLGWLWMTFFLVGFSGVVYLLATYLLDVKFSVSHYFFLVSSPSTALITQSQSRGGAEAALLLARTGDTRAVRYLAGLWMPRPLTRREKAFNESVTRELTRLLTERNGDRYDLETEDALRRLLKHARPKRWKLPTPLHTRHDLTEADADLLLCVVRHLSQRPLIGQTAAQVADDAAVRRVAEDRTDARTGEYRTLLRDTAQTLLVGRGKSVQ